MTDFWIWSFLNAHPFLAWCALWLCWAVVPLTWHVYLLCNRVLRTLKVLLRGWPPAHLDADGDWKQAEQDR